MKRFFLLSILLLSFSGKLFATDFAALRQTWRDEVALGPTDYASTDALIMPYVRNTASSAKQYSASMHRDTTFLWDDFNFLSANKSFTPAHINSSYNRLLIMARAWAYPGTTAYHDAQLLDDVRFGLNYLYANAYNEKTRPIGNWWEWKIGIPWLYSQIVSILYDELSQEERAAFVRSTRSFVWPYLNSPSSNPTYGNLASACRNLLAIGVLSENEKDIQAALNLSIPAFYDDKTPAQRESGIAAHVRSLRRQTDALRSLACYRQEGLYEDGSFIQHYAVPYIGTYGVEVVQLASYFARTLQGVDVQIPDKIVSSLPIWISKAYLPAIYKGEMLLMYMGRANINDAYSNGRNCALNMAEASYLIPDSAERQTILIACADILRSQRRFDSFYSGWGEMPLYKHRLDAAVQKVEQGSETVAPFSVVQAAADRVVHQTPRFRFALSMSSNRVAKYEGYDRATGKQNLTGWYLGDGMTYIYTPDDADQYNYYYMQESNPYRVAGTTVDLIPREPCATVDLVFDHQANAARIARAGGVMLDGIYSSAMMQLLGSKSNLQARKSWFMFDDEIVCLGADICLDAEREVITTIENRRFSRPLYVQDRRVTAPQDRVIENVLHVVLEGTGGYYFPTPVTLHANLSDKNYTELWLSHGIAPTKADYAYVLLPAMTRREVLTYAAQPQVEILANTPALQAVRESVLGITAMNFWEKGAFEGVKSDGVAAVLMKRGDDTLKISVSDPTWDRSTIVLTLDGKYELVETSHPERISLKISKGKTEIKIRVAHFLGMTQTLTLREK